MRSILLAAIFLTPMVMAKQPVMIDQTFCETRALLGKVAIEGRLRGESSEDVKRDIEAIANVTPADSIVRAVKPLGLMDVDGLFKTKRDYSPMQAYMDLHNTCRDLRGQIVSL